MFPIILSILILSTTSNAAVQDFCVADLKAAAGPTGYSCKNPATVTIDDFIFSGFRKPGNTSNTIKTAVTPASRPVPRCQRLGISVARLGDRARWCSSTTLSPLEPPDRRRHSGLTGGRLHLVSQYRRATLLNPLTIPKTMPAGKLRRAIGAVKDQTSIGLAKFSLRSSALEVAVLRATSHDEYPVDDRRYTEVLLLASSNPAATAEFVHTLTRRITRTHNWIVALKALSLTFIALRDFRSPNFAREALAASHRGGPRLLDLSGFTDDSGGSSPWDFTAFVQDFRPLP
ncbi:hypothetical protein J5N97_009404 [Dioscorea zingiberensis]|uniref:ENTH domain-containing protein n=1 Tax=Dioscorea zingiberensis TaxID=325984 RepID=A0A9D5CY70_9LILI|nr:hypothetical protein J5N97_009404 [Dioscorea zingiberensis]